MANLGVTGFLDLREKWAHSITADG